MESTKTENKPSAKTIGKMIADKTNPQIATSCHISVPAKNNESKKYQSMLQLLLGLDILLLFLYLIGQQDFHLSPVIGSGIAIAASLIFILKQHLYQERRFSSLEQKQFKPQKTEQKITKDKEKSQKACKAEEQQQKEREKISQSLQDKHTAIKKIHTSLQDLEKLQKENKKMHTKIHQQIDTLKKKQQEHENMYMKNQKKDKVAHSQIKEKMLSLEKKEIQYNGAHAQLQEKIDILQKKQKELQGVYKQVQKQGQDLRTHIQQQIETLHTMQKQQQQTDTETDQKIINLKSKQEEYHNLTMAMQKEHDNTAKKIQKQHQDVHQQVHKEIEALQKKHKNILDTDTEFQKQIEKLQKKQKEQDNKLNQIQEQQNEYMEIQKQQQKMHVHAQQQIKTLENHYNTAQKKTQEQLSTLLEMQKEISMLNTKQMEYHMLQQKLAHMLDGQEKKQHTFQSLINKQVCLEERVAENKKNQQRLLTLGQLLQHTIRSSGLIPQLPNDANSPDFSPKEVIIPSKIKFQNIDLVQPTQNNKKEDIQGSLNTLSNILSKERNEEKSTPNGKTSLAAKIRAPLNFHLQSWAKIETFDFEKSSAFLAQSLQSLSHIGIHVKSFSCHVHKHWEGLFSDEVLGGRARKSTAPSQCNEELSVIPGSVQMEIFEDFRYKYEKILPTGDPANGLPVDVIARDEDEVNFWSFVWYMTKMEAVTKGTQAQELTNENLYALLPVLDEENNCAKLNDNPV